MTFLEVTTENAGYVFLRHSLR